jgi:hypothetical protein
LEADSKSKDWWRSQFEARPKWTYSDDASGDESAQFVATHVYLNYSDMRRWERAYRGADLDPDLYRVVNDSGRYHMKEQEEALRRTYSKRHVSDWPRTKDGLLEDSISQVIVIIFVTCIYGALHAICWHSHFPSRAEQWLWRTSSLVIAAAPGVTVPPLLITAFLRRLQRQNGMTIATAFGMLALGLTIGIVSSYIVARIFILVEAFISLRNLPAGAYQTPSWTAWLLHL